MLILASNSPRRKEILKEMGFDFKVIPSSFDEKEIKDPFIKSRKPLLLSKYKALNVYETCKDDIVLGSDTVVIYKNKIYEKPVDEQDAFRMLKDLSNHTHIVVTGVCIVSKNYYKNFIVKAKVKFKNLTDNEIWDYIKTGEPMDKAGAYGYQGIGNKLVEKVIGDKYVVIGLPYTKLYPILKKLL